MRYALPTLLCLCWFVGLRGQTKIPFEVYCPPSLTYESVQSCGWDSVSKPGSKREFKSSITVMITETKPYDQRTFDFYITNLSDTPLVCKNARYLLSNLKVKYTKQPIPHGKLVKLATIQVSSPSPPVPFVKWCEILTNRGIIYLQFRQRGLESIKEN